MRYRAASVSKRLKSEPTCRLASCMGVQRNFNNSAGLNYQKMASRSGFAASPSCAPVLLALHVQAWHIGVSPVHLLGLRLNPKMISAWTKGFSGLDGGWRLGCIHKTRLPMKSCSTLFSTLLCSSGPKVLRQWSRCRNRQVRPSTPQKLRAVLRKEALASMQAISPTPRFSTSVRHSSKRRLHGGIKDASAAPNWARLCAKHQFWATAI